MSYYKWTGKITKIGKKDKPSYYILIPKFVITENGLKIDGKYEVQASLIEGGELNENGNTTNEHTSI